jgi:hypothetical protein
MSMRRKIIFGILGGIIAIAVIGTIAISGRNGTFP